LLALVVALVIAACGCSATGGGRAGAERRKPPSTSSTSTTTTAPVADPNPLTGAGPGVDVYQHTRAGMLSPAVLGVPARVYVPNSLSNTVDVIDPTTFRVVEHFAVGAKPQHVVPSYDLSTLYVNNNAGNSLTPINPRTAAPGPPITVPDPYNLYYTPDGSRAIVMAERNGEIDVRDPHTWALVEAIRVPHAGVNHADFTPNGRVMIVSCEFSGWLVRIDLTTLTITGELHVGGAPIDVRSSPDGSVMYVANQERSGVSVIDPATMRELSFIPTGRGAHGLYPSRDGTKLYVSNRMAGSVSVIDFATQAVVATWPIGGTPDMGGVSADGGQLWLTGRYSNAVYVIDTATGRLLHTVPVGLGPHGLCFFPQPGRFSLGHTANYR
jgi:YVTN family beta-propeller protein